MFKTVYLTNLLSFNACNNIKRIIPHDSHHKTIRQYQMIFDKAKKKNCYVALTRPKFENWVGRSGFFFFFFFFYVP